MLKLSKTAKKQLAKIGAAVTVGIATIQAKAVSMLPADALDTLATNVQDTATDVTGNILPISIAVTLTFAVIGMTRRGLSKGGIK
jgi:hypothetical protein